MPHVTVQVQEGVTKEQKRKLLKEISWVTAEALDIRTELVRVMIQETQRDCFACGGMTSEDGIPQTPFLMVYFVEGFAEEKRKQLILNLSRTTAEILETDQERVKGIFQEVSRGAWANGGILLSDR